MPKIEGRNPVYEALRGNRKIHRIFIQEKINAEVIDNILEIEDFDIQVFRNEEDYSKAVIIIERHFLKDEYTEKEFDKKQDELINNLNNWIKIN